MSTPRIVASIEARMGSSRLPGKVLADVEGKPALSRLVERLRQAKELDDIVLATSVASADDALEAWAISEEVKYYRGSEDNVLNRVVEAHRMMKSDVIVEITGDCTLLDPDVIDQAIQTYRINQADVVANVDPLSYPQGVDVQVFGFDLLAQVESQFDDPVVQEHVSIRFYRNPDIYRLIRLVAPLELHRPELRFQLDYPEDLEFIRQVYRELLPAHGNSFRTKDILSLLERKPELAAINGHCEETVIA